ncbi:MAG TPA: polysaccharide deacetylase, partial [Blastocatellia bacterium]|nr:polysaccharide deacetylase [Blastocatellia bacterium]
MAGLLFSSLFGILIVSILSNPFLPKLNLPKASFLPNDARPPTAELIETAGQRKLRETKQRLEVERSKRQAARHPRKPSHDPNIDQLDVGFYVAWDETSMSSLKENIKNLDMVIGEFLHLETADGALTEESKDNPDGPNEEKAATGFIRSTRPDLQIFALVNNFNGPPEAKTWQSDKLAAMLASPEARARCIDQLVDYAIAHDFAGIS